MPFFFPKRSRWKVIAEPALSRKAGLIHVEALCTPWRLALPSKMRRLGVALRVKYGHT
jgi:hypothetical protein